MADANAFEAILFDFDGVLVDSEPVHYACWQEILAPFDIRLSWETYAVKGIGYSDRDLIRFLCEQRTPPLEFDTLYAEYPRKKQIYRDRMLTAAPVSDEIRQLLDELADYKLAVVSSSNSAEVIPILEAAGLLDRFATVVCGNHVPRLKPAPDPYLIAAERLGVRMALVVEDSEAGAQSGAAAGFEVLRVPEASKVPGLVRQRIRNFR